MEGAGDDLFNHGTDGRQKTLRRAPEIGAWQERKMNALVHALYGLSLEEIETVEKG
jgi:hypothetical protein